MRSPTIILYFHRSNIKRWYSWYRISIRTMAVISVTQVFVALCILGVVLAGKEFHPYCIFCAWNANFVRVSILTHYIHHNGRTKNLLRFFFKLFSEILPKKSSYFILFFSFIINVNFKLLSISPKKTYIAEKNTFSNIKAKYWSYYMSKKHL